MKSVFNKYNPLRNAFPVAVLLLLAFSLYQCGGLEKEIELDLPAYESQLVVECYLEPMEPYKLLLTKSAAFFDPLPTEDFDFLENILEDSAEVFITVNGEVIELRYQLYFDPVAQKLYNYFNQRTVPYDTISEFSLNIRTKDGKEVFAQTRILPIVPIDSVVVEFNEEVDSLARVLTYLTDNPNQNNYYRRMLHSGSLDTIPEQDFTTNDDFVDNEILVFGSGYEYKDGDVIYNSIFHIDRPYYDFLESLFYAIDANGNPFGQPAAINSNLQGDAIGVFTGLSVDRKITVVTK